MTAKDSFLRGLHLDPWDSVVLGRKIPAPCRVRIKPMTSYAQGKPGSFAIEVLVGRKNVEAADRFIDGVRPKKNAPTKPRRVRHPELQFLAIRRAVVVGVNVRTTPGPFPGTRYRTIRCIEYFTQAERRGRWGPVLMPRARRRAA